MMLQLIIDGRAVAPDEIVAHHTFRFCLLSEGIAEPVLYTDGKREIRSWCIEMTHLEPRDPHGRSG